MNAQSLRNKTAMFIDYICDLKLDIIAVTETWLSGDDDAIKAECIPDGYKLELGVSRSERRGGGAALIYRSSITVKQINVHQRSSFEISEFSLAHDSWRVRLAIFYRTPYSRSHPVTLATFIAEFFKYLESLMMCTEPLLICGDFNVHLDDPQNYYTTAFTDILDSMNLTQHVHFSTQVHGHTLDLIVTRKSDTLVSGSPYPGCFFSDHMTVLCNLNLLRPSYSIKRESYRKLKSINIDLFKDDLCSSDLCQRPPSGLDSLVSCYNTTLKALLDKHAPIRSRRMVVRPCVPWFTDEISVAKRKQRKAERRWRKTKLMADWNVFKSIKNSTTFLMNNARKEFYTNTVNECSGDQRKLFDVLRKLLNKKRDSSFPPHCDKKTLANDLGMFFVKKIADIRAGLDSVSNCDKQRDDRFSSVRCSSSLRDFALLDADSVRTLVAKAPNKSCHLDPVPTSIVKQCLDELLPVFTTIINSSLQTGSFPDHWKLALVNPLLKQPGLELVFRNFRPVCNLPFVSKLTEKTAAVQLSSYLVTNNLFPLLQSAYRPHHSTETALLKVKNDILMNMDKQHVTLLVLLDLSAAFDTVNHVILLDRLKTEFGVSGTVLDWFASYLSDRSQRVSIDGVMSEKFDLDCGVPQGSCLGPLLFVIYSSKLFQIIQTHLPDAHCYADDSQLYLSFKPGNVSCEKIALHAMELCIADIKTWMLSDKLKLNSEKTEFLIIGTRQQLSKINVPDLSIAIGDCRVEPSTEPVKNLGSWFDSQLTMVPHINKSCGAAFYHLHNIRRIRKYLSRQAAEALVHAFVTSKIDYCNSLLYGLPSTHIQKLQRVQNAAARLVTGSARFCRITPLFISLHWLPVKFRINYKIVLLTFKCIYGLAPAYLADMILVKSPTRYNLRSNCALQLVPSSVKHRATLGDRAFQQAAPTLWNALPPTIRNISSFNVFKTAVKTYYFKLAFNL